MSGEETAAPPRRMRLPGARDDRLYYARVYEDPLLEIEALAPTPRDTVVVVSSGGCTALSLLSAGAGHVTAVDLNATQNHMLELKFAAVRHLAPAEALAWLGAAPLTGAQRLARYRVLRGALTAGARAYWDARPRALRRGVLRAGVSERFLELVMRVVRLGIHPESRIRRLLACRSVAEQRALYEREWNSWRWRALYALLFNRRVFSRAYDPTFFANVANPSFSRHFHALFERTVTELPVADNYFLHMACTGRYPTPEANGVPPYLSATGIAALRAGADRLTLVDGRFTDYLRTLPPASIQGFGLSNICEWLDERETDALFGEVARTAAPGARLVFRNFVGWTEVPVRWRAVVVEDRARGEAMIRRDRAMVNRRIAPCRVRAEAA